MKFLFLLLFCIYLAVVPAGSLRAQSVDVITFEELEREFKKTDADVYIFNFWATWCRPCVNELPYFEAVQAKYKDQKVQVVLVSLDNVRDLERKVIPFVNKHQLKSKVLLLNDTDYNSWIDKVSAEWGGSIPATLIIHGKTREKTFLEQELTLDELETLVKNNLK